MGRAAARSRVARDGHRRDAAGGRSGDRHAAAHVDGEDRRRLRGAGRRRWPRVRRRSHRRRESGARAVLRCRNRQGDLEARRTRPATRSAIRSARGRRRRSTAIACTRSAPWAICFASMRPPATFIWQKHLPTDFGTELPAWGMAGAPLVDGDQLIVLAGGKPGAMVVSLDKRTGQERWRALDGKEPGYCAPVILEIGGQRQLIVWHPAAVAALDPGQRQGAVGGAVRSPGRHDDFHAATGRQPPVRHRLLQRAADDRPRRRRHAARMCCGELRHPAPRSRTTRCTP